MFEHVKRTNPKTFVVVLLAAVLLPVAVFYVFPSGVWEEQLYLATAGLVRPALLFSATAASLTLLYVFTLGGLRPRDLGLNASLPRALLFTALLWGLTQLGITLWQLGTAGQITWNGAWLEPGATFVLGELVQQLFGNALYEEIVWRGFIFVQLLLFLRQRGVRRPVVAALLLSQLGFALLHIPLQLERFGRSWTELPFWLLATGVAGIVFATLYLKTQNLFVAVGFHAIFNEPTQLFAPPVEPSQIPATIVTLIGLVLVFMPGVRRWWQEAPTPA